MPQISIFELDRLHDLFIRLEILTYLQTLVRNEECDHFALPDSMEDGKENASDFLLDLQTETVTDLHAILFSPPFCNADMPLQNRTENI